MPRRRQNITARAFDKRGRLLAVAQNSYVKTHPLQRRYSRNTHNPRREYLHAELACLLKAAARGHVHKLVVTRVNRAGHFVLAKPCDACIKAIADFGVREVEHT